MSMIEMPLMSFMRIARMRELETRDLLLCNYDVENVPRVAQDNASCVCRVID